MRTAALALLALSSACVVVERPVPSRAVYSPAAVAQPAPAAAPAPRPAIGRDEAVRRAFDFARDRGLEVDRVHEATLDGRGRWRIELRGQGDRARMLIDARDGRLLKGRFRESDPEVDD